MSDTTTPSNTIAATQPQVPKQAAAPVEESLPPTPGFRRYRRPLVVLLAVTAIAVAVTVVWAILPGTMTVKGSITLNAPGNTVSGVDGCQGTGGFSDMHQGATVTVYDASGEAVAMAPLQIGITESTSSTTYPYSSTTCRFAFEATDVPDDSANYTVELGNRGKMTYLAEATKNGQIALTLGN